MISHKKKFIFIHIPKTAGMTLINALESYQDEDGFKFGHPPQSRYVDQFAVNEYYQFSFVRNPWDRLCSAFFFLKKGGINEDDRKACEKLNLKTMSFADFVIKHDPYNSHLHFLPQHTFFNHDFNQVDIMKFENLQSNFDLVCSKIGINAISLSHHNKTEKKHYSEYYNEDMIRAVQEKYSKDIQLFKYEFNEQSQSI
jgi:hypothetical protein